MIIAEGKPFKEVYEFTRDHDRVLLLGCGTCVTVCMAGGEKETGILASQIRIAAKKRGDSIEVEEHTIIRQCDREFFDETTTKKIEEADAVISLACGVGVQYAVEIYGDIVIYPALNTKCYGANIEQGIWSERCAGCGQCVIHQYGGLCPIARCSKSIMNGPCGGSADGKCEVDPDSIDCIWQNIYDRMDKLGRLSELEENKPFKDWSSNRDGGPRTIKREDLTL